MAQNTYKTPPDKDTNKKRTIKWLELDQRTKIAIGLLFQGLSLFLGFAFAAHLIHGANDQSIVEAVHELGIRKSGMAVQNWLGITGAFVSHYMMHMWWGVTAFLFLPALFLFGLKMTVRNLFSATSLFKVCVASLFFVLWFNILLGYLYVLYPTSQLLAQQLGGVGFALGALFKGLLGYGTLLLLLVSLLAFCVCYFNVTALPHFGCFAMPKKKPTPAAIEADPVATTHSDFEEKKKPIRTLGATVPQAQADASEISSIHKPNKEVDFEVVSAPPKEEIPPSKPPQPAVGPRLSLDQLRSENYDPTLDLSNYRYPTLDLLEHYTQETQSVGQEELEINKNNIVQTLNNFKINIAKIKATIGPTVTLYEIVPEAGVKISKIKNLEDDIALNLAALGIRIIAPIPGKGTIGIEVPNKHREIVPLQQMLACDSFLKGKMDLPVVLGKSISNEMLIADLARMPHLLIAGATGQGKSVGLNVLLTSLIYKKHPSQLKLVLVDPKKVELSLYTKLERHFLAKLPVSEEAIITETKKVVHTLNSLCIEMDHRYELLKEAGTRNIKEYNEKFVRRVLHPQEGHRFLPYIVLVIDEFADMMMTAGKEIEVPIARLAQLARAIGIHLVLATQRPSVNVITGIIKANFPVRISYKVSSKIDSRTILDASGAEQLVGNGDMLLSMNSDIIRLQAPFLDTEEVERVCGYIGAQQGYASAYLLPIYDEEDSDDGVSFDPNHLDPLFEEAARLIVLHQQGSTSLIQRKLKLGYNRSGRLIDQLEAAGIVGPFEGSKARAVLVPTEEALDEIIAKRTSKV